MNDTVPNRRVWPPKLLTLAFAVGSFSGFSGPAQAADPTEPANPLSCGAPDRPASIVQNPIPETPTFAQLTNAHGDAVVRVNLSPDGMLEDAAIYQSSGNAFLDREALRVARESKYSPAIQICRAVPGSYLYTVSFEPGL